MIGAFARPLLRPGEVHAWHATTREENRGHAVSMDELRRADRFRNSGDGARYLARRGILRSILGMYLGVEPCNLEFTYGRFGKPALAGRESSQDVRFSMSHSGGCVVIALARGREVGIDVERCRPGLVTRRAVELVLSPREAARLWALDSASRSEEFFRAWTRLEARLKASGEGFARTGTWSATERGSNVGSPEDGCDSWSVEDLPMDDGYAGALAVAGRGYELQCWTWR